jgi:predicted transcriptional regulator of viral defense system
MKLDDLAAKVPPYGVFRTGQILSGEQSPANVRRQLNRWVKRGRVIQLRRGVYVLAEPYAKTTVHPFMAANALRNVSYVSLQSALAHYGMIPEYVPVTTSVTTGRPEELSTPIGRFQFRHVSTPLLYGFGEVEIARNQVVLLASPQKALVDLLYLTPHSDRSDYLRELRLERPEYFDLDALYVTVEHGRSAKVERAVRRLIELWEDEA